MEMEPERRLNLIA
jgi:3-hydroxyisobutyryl-CoA hydrolase